MRPAAIRLGESLSDQIAAVQKMGGWGRVDPNKALGCKTKSLEGEAEVTLYVLQFR